MKKRARDLLDSAVRVLTDPPSTFIVKPWEEIMREHLTPTTFVRAGRRSTDPIIPTDRASAAAGLSGRRRAIEDATDVEPVGSGGTGTRKVIGTRKAGDSQPDRAVVNSGFSAFNQTAAPAKENPVSNDTPTLDPAAKQAEKEATIKAKIAAKEAKQKEQAEAKAKREAEAKAKAEQRDADKQARAEAAAKKAEELKAAGRTYVGSMVALTERAKSGTYVKSATGQLRTTDELAVALDAVPPANVIALGLQVLGLETNPYAHLNVGQQSMNLRNRIRGAIKAGKVTIADVEKVRDDNGLATALADREAKEKAKADREAAAAAKKAEAAAKKQVQANAAEAKVVAAHQPKTAEQMGLTAETAPAKPARKSAKKAEAAAAA